jgi:hypothetical protein
MIMPTTRVFADSVKVKLTAAGVCAEGIAAATRFSIAAAIWALG